MIQGPTLHTTWLHNVGFRLGHPFATREASGEPASALVQYFVLRPGFEDVRGSARRPESAMLKADRGAGKSISRVALALLCRAGQMDAPVLAIDYVDFERPLAAAGAPAAMTVGHHVDEILRVGMAALFNALADRPQRATGFIGGVRRQLAHYLWRYTDLLNDIGLDTWLAGRGLLDEACQAEGLRQGRVPNDAPFLRFVAELLAVPVPATSPAPPTEAFAAFVSLARNAGYEAVYVLVDRVDERQPMAADPDQAAALLAALVGDLMLMDQRHAAFKFFVTPAVVRALAARLGDAFRPRRLMVRDISWDVTGLKELLDRRVAVFSEGALPSLDAAAETPIVARLAVAAEGSPRSLLRLAEWTLYWQHWRAGQRGILWLTTDDAERAIASFRQEREAYFVAPDPEPPAAAPPPTDLPMIRIDEAHETWVGARCVGQLSKKRHLLLACLLADEGRVLSYDHIGQYIHGDEWTREGLTLDSIDGLVKWLRKDLGIDAGKGKEKIIRKVPGGYLFRQPPHP